MAAAARFSLAGHGAIVTGATKGIGLAVVKDLVELGATVVGVARNVDGEAGAALPPGVHALRADVASRSGREELMATAEALLREGGAPLSILVNSAWPLCPFAASASCQCQLQPETSQQRAACSVATPPARQTNSPVTAAMLPTDHYVLVTHRRGHEHPQAHYRLQRCRFRGCPEHKLCISISSLTARTSDPQSQRVSP